MSSQQPSAGLFSAPQLKLAFASIGVVFGDIGTSPIYTMREALLPVTRSGADLREAVLGVNSLLVWALTLIVTIKYVIIVMRVDNRGEGGILSEVVLVKNLIKRRAEWVVICGIIGAGFFFGDAIITPAISVLSAVEGLSVISPDFKPYVLSIALAVLFALFVFQYKGTAGVAKLFAPITFFWFLVLAFVGIWHLSDDWAIFAALNPLHGVAMLINRPALSLLVIGGVFLAVTGAEALYADMGHFGKNPIRMAWLGVAFPALVLNYLGQGAFVIAHPDAVSNPFFLMFPAWSLVPSVILTTMVTVIASQAVITGAYSIAQQAMSLNLLPRMIISHTSETESGQIYVSQINWLLMVGVIMLVLIFRSSDNLASAYGIAVNAAMLINAVLSILYFWNAKTMSRWIAVPALVLILGVELVFMALERAQDRKWWLPAAAHRHCAHHYHAHLAAWPQHSHVEIPARLRRTEQPPAKP